MIQILEYVENVLNEGFLDFKDSGNWADQLIPANRELQQEFDQQVTRLHKFEIIRNPLQLNEGLFWRPKETHHSANEPSIERFQEPILIIHALLNHFLNDLPFPILGFLGV